MPDRPGASLAIFSKIAAQNIAVDMIVQNVGADGIADISFTVAKDELPTTLQAVEAAADELEAEGFSHDDDVARSRSSGWAWPRKPASPERCFTPWPTPDVNILMITHQRDQNLGAGQPRPGGQRRCGPCTEAFELDKESASTPTARPATPAAQPPRRHSGHDCDGRSSPGCSGWKT